MRARDPEIDMNPSAGFTLIELMVAAAIFAFGVLGLAAMQGQGLKFNGNAYERSQAVILASDMADRIRANLNAGGSNAFLYGAISGPAVAPVAPAPSTCTGTGNTCTAAEMEAVDAYEWLSLVEQVLPGGSGKVTCSSAPACAAGDTYAIKISWTGKFGTASHTISVRP